MEHLPVSAHSPSCREVHRWHREKPGHGFPQHEQRSSVPPSGQIPGLRMRQGKKSARRPFMALRLLSSALPSCESREPCLVSLIVKPVSGLIQYSQGKLRSLRKRSSRLPQRNSMRRRRKRGHKTRLKVNAVYIFNTRFED